MATQKTTKKDLLKAEEQQQASAVNRVTSLPLLNSAFNLVSSAYNYTKETHPCLSGVCNVAETMAAVAVGSVVGGAQPILNQLEPQIALVNEYACKGLDQLEENLPFLQQPADKVISDTKQLVSTKVTSAMDAACEAKEAMANKVTEAVDLTKTVVGDSVKLTRSVVTSTINSAVEAAHGAKDLVTNKVTEAVDLTKHVVEDSIEQTKSAVASTIVNAVEAAQGAKDLVTSKVTTKVTEAVEAAQGAKDLVTNKVTEAVDLSKHVVEDSIEQTKSAVASTVVNAVEAAQGAKDLVTTKVTEAVEGAKDLVTNKVTEAVDFSKHIVEDSVGRTKSAVASTIVNAVEAAQGAKDLVTNKVTEAVDLSKHMVEDSVGRTKSAVASTISAAVEAAQGAKDLVTNKVTEAMDLTKGAVQDSVEKTKSVVTSTVSTALDAAYGTITSKINTALEQGKEALQEGVEMTNLVVTNSISKAKAVSQAVEGGVEAVLGMSEDLVDHYLPMTEEELGKLATSEGSGMASVEEQRQNKSYFVHLGSLSNKVQRRAYHLSLHKLQHLRQRTQETLSRLQLAIKLIESVKGEVGQKLLDGQEKLYQLWLDWSLTQPKGNQVRTASQVEVESRTLTMLHIITQQLQPIYENLKASIQGLPSHIQEAVYQATRNIHKLHKSFSSAVSFQDLSSTTLTRSQDRVAEARRSLDVLLEYVTQNTPLSWVVGPFKAVAPVSQGSRKQKKEDLVLEKATSSEEGAKTPEEPKGAHEILGEGSEVLEKLEEKAEKDAEVALAAKEVKTKAPEEDL
ncbi:perilipin-3 isoform X1 [Melopsittacus undulatus]|uniref:perilipin-3 isoform X1 n=1 Tax=Melopsittacus undulatus TaxID=13146 RepID=UPI00146D14A8|nr:perilipin-3 isoform X1 [Melopsittacus undulatus]XP_033926569.1 perilipin-3 isoform X1 [Melopsittacus undulatus]